MRFHSGGIGHGVLLAGYTDTDASLDLLSGTGDQESLVAEDETLNMPQHQMNADSDSEDEGLDNDEEDGLTDHELLDSSSDEDNLEDDDYIQDGEF